MVNSAENFVEDWLSLDRLPERGRDFGNLIERDRFEEDSIRDFVELLGFGLLLVVELVIVEAESVEVELVHSSEIGLSFATNPANAVWFAAKALLGVVAITVNVVVESQLFSLFDVSFGEDSHSLFIPDRPLCDHAVWSARVIQKPPESSLFCGIDEDVAIECHKVKVFDSLVGIVAHSTLKEGWSDHLADVLVHERVTRQVVARSNSESLLVSFDNLNVCVLSVLKALILALAPCAAVLRLTFNLE